MPNPRIRPRAWRRPVCSPHDQIGRRPHRRDEGFAKQRRSSWFFGLSRPPDQGNGVAGAGSLNGPSSGQG